MKKNNIGYLLREGFRGVFLHGFMSFAAICVTVACLIIMGTNHPAESLLPDFR